MSRLVPIPDDAHLREAIKTTLTQICKVGVHFTSEICIEGTIGVTVDKKKVTLIHFNEQILSAENDVESTTQGVVGVAPGSVVQPPQPPELPAEAANLRLLGAETLSSLHEYLNRTVAAPPPALPTTSPEHVARRYYSQPRALHGYFPPDTPSKLLTLNETIAIDIDSDSESFSSIQYDDGTAERGGAQIDCKTKSLLQAPGKNLRDVKNIIVIDDNTELFGSVNPIDGGYSFDTADTSMNKYDEGGNALEDPPEFHIGSSEDIRFRMSATSSTVTHASPPELSPQQGESLTESGAPDQVDTTTPLGTKIKPHFNCEICGKRLHNLIALENHLVSTHNITESVRFGKIKYFECDTCNKKFRYQTLLDKHLRKHSQLRPYACKICRNSYRHRESLEIHRKVHTNDFGCHFCNKKYTSKVLFQKHIIYMHDRDKINIKSPKGQK